MMIQVQEFLLAALQMPMTPKIKIIPKHTMMTITIRTKRAMKTLMMAS
jgi:hypothetical protein